MFIINTVSTCFGHHYAHLQENKDRVLLHVVCCAALHHTTLPSNRHNACISTPAPDTPDLKNVRGRYQSNTTTHPFAHDIHTYTQGPN